MVEGGQRAHHAHHYRHRMRVATEAVEKARQLVMHHRVMFHQVAEFNALRSIWQFAVQQQIAYFQKIRFLGQLLDRISAVIQQSGIAINKSNF